MTLLIVLAVIVFVPLVSYIGSSIDYKRQITGKRKMRTLKDQEALPTEAQPPDLKMEGIYYEARVRMRALMLR